MQTLFLTSFHPLITRNILGTGLLALLGQQDIRVVLFAREEKIDFFEKEYGAPHVLFEGFPDEFSWRDIFLRAFSLALLETQTLDIKRKTEMQGRGTWAKIFFSFFPRQVREKFVRKLSAMATPNAIWKEKFEQYRPDAVFSTDVQNERDVQMLHEAKRGRIPAIGMVRSWDNLTSKGLLRCIPNMLVVHNDIIAREAELFHGIDPEKIKKIGIPHYDRYREPRVSSRQDFCRRIGANPEKKILLYVPIGDRYLRKNTVDKDILDILDREVDQNYTILVRLPPGDTVKDFEGEHGPGRIIFDHAQQARTLVGALTPADDAHLIDTLYWSDLVVSGPSTMCIDAAFFDKPTILIGFDGYDGQRPYYESVRRYYDYNHFQPIMASGGVRLAKSKSELLDAIAQYTIDPSLDSEGRRRIVEEQLLYPDAESTKRLLDVIQLVLKK